MSDLTPKIVEQVISYYQRNPGGKLNSDQMTVDSAGGIEAFARRVCEEMLREERKAAEKELRKGQMKAEVTEGTLPLTVHVPRTVLEDDDYVSGADARLKTHRGEHRIRRRSLARQTRNNDAYGQELDELIEATDGNLEEITQNAHKYLEEKKRAAAEDAPATEDEGATEQ